MPAYQTKRIFDFIASLLLIIVTLPVQIVIYLITLVTLKGNPLFIQERGVTLEKFRFRMIKFRTLKNSDGLDSNKVIDRQNFLISDYHTNLNSFSKFIRSTGLDELPQLFNVITGKMSLVGPRPLMIDELLFLKNEFPEIYNRRNSMKSLPGLTGVWQIFGDRNYGAKNLIELDSFYESNKSIILDFRILFYTFVIITHAKNSTSILSRLNLFEKIFTTSFYPEDKNEGKIVIVDSGKGLKKYRINLPVEWWYINDSIITTINESPKLSVIQFRKDASK